MFAGHVPELIILALFLVFLVLLVALLVALARFAWDAAGRHSAK